VKVTVVIPTRNEEKTIRKIIRGCKPHADEVLLVDGHSTDRTAEIAAEEGVRVVLDNGRGKGAGLRKAIEVVENEIICFIDADCSHDPDDIPKLVNPIKEGVADLVIGSRMRGGSDELHGDIGKFIRMVGSDIITLTINYRFGARCTDSQNGFRALRTDVGRKLDLKEDIFTIEQEMLIKTLKKGYRAKEIPTHEYKRAFGESGIDVSKVWFRYGWSVIKNLF
jgi:dolichol-phosphate mannosyltransferase